MKCQKAGSGKKACLWLLLLVCSVAAPHERVVTRLPPIGRQVGLLQILVADRDVHVPWVPKRARARSPAEAEKLARKLADSARHGADFVALAKQYSDWPLAAANGGQLGILTEDTGVMPELTDKGLALEMGGVSDPISTSLGYAVLKRLPLMRISHIAIAYQGLPGSKETRTRKEAEELIARIHAELASGKRTFAEEAFDHSDDLVSAGRGGDLGAFDEKSPLMPQIRNAATHLQKGQVSAPFESPLGLELVLRVE